MLPRASFGLVLLLNCVCFSALAADAVDERTKPLSFGEIAYTGGAFTPDGLHFVYAVVPKAGSNISDVRALDTRNGKVETLGQMNLLSAQPANADMFAWSMGVLGAENDLSTIYLAQYGPNEDLDPKAAVAWSAKDKKIVAAKIPDLGAMQKVQSAAPVGLKVTLADLDAAAEKWRKEYQPVEQMLAKVGKKELTIELGGKPVKVDATEAYRELYAAAVADYPLSKFPGDSGKILVNDSVEPVAQAGKWVFVRCGFYAHYGIRGRGFDRLVLINTSTLKVSTMPDIGSHSASGVRTGPIETAFYRASDGKCAIGIGNGKATLYRFPAE